MKQQGRNEMRAWDGKGKEELESSMSEDRKGMKKRRRGRKSGAAVCICQIWHDFNSSQPPSCVCVGL